MKKNRETIHVLITCAGGLQGATLLKELSLLQEVIPHVADLNEENITKYHTPFYHISPAITDVDKYVRFIKNLVDEFGIKFIFPASVYDLEILAALNLEKTKAAVCSSSLLHKLLHKGRLYDWLCEEGLKSFKPMDMFEASSSLPVIGKPADSWGGKGIKVVHYPHEWAALSKVEKSELIWTQLIDGFIEYSVDLAVDFSGAVSPLVVRRRQRVSGGYAVVMEFVPQKNNPPLHLCALELAELLASNGACGLINAQILSSGNEFFISDVNPRIGTSSVMGIHVGINLSSWVLGNQSSSTLCQSPLRLVRNLQERTMLLQKFNQIKAIVFDLDDTLIAHKPWIRKKFQFAVHTVFNNHPREEDILDYGYLLIEEAKTDILFDLLCKHFSFDNYKDALIESYRMYIPELDIFPDVLPSLEYLKSSGYTLVLLTDNPVLGQKQKIDKFPYISYLDDILFSRDVDAEKPDITVFQMVMKKTGFKADELAMVGDHGHRDIYGAYKAGFGAAFKINRQEALFNTTIPLRKNNCLNIYSLGELSWYL